MPTKKVQAKKVVKKVVKEVSEPVVIPEEPMYAKFLTPRWVAIICAVVVLAGILYLNKGLIVAGMVNNRPIWRWDVENRMVSRYGKQTVDELVNENLLQAEARKRNVSVTSKDVDEKISQIEKSLAGKVTLKDALSQQGMTMEELRRQVELQVMVERITDQTVKISDKDIDDFIASNASSFSSSDAGQMREEAKQALLSEKRSSSFQTIFEEIKKNAKIVKFF